MRSKSTLVLVMVVVTICLVVFATGATYQTTITRVGDNFYKVDHTKVYIRTQACYEFPYGEEVIIKYDCDSCAFKGRLIFVESETSYDILGVYREISLE